MNAEDHMMLPNQRPFINALPPAEVRFREVHVEPWSDGGRIRVHVSLTPFQKPPNIEVVISTIAGEEVASASIIETMTVKLVITLHLRHIEPKGQFRLTARLYYPELDAVDHANVDFNINPPLEPA